MRFMRKTKRRAVPPLFFSAYEIELKGIRYVFMPFLRISRKEFSKNVSRETLAFFPNLKIKGEKPSFSVFFCRNTSIRPCFRRCFAAYLNLIPSAYFLGFP